MVDFKGVHFPKEAVLICVRWYLAYPLSYRNIEEMMAERGLNVDHSTLNRWVVKFAPLLEKEFRSRKRPVGSSWRMDETYIKVQGKWKYLYRAVDKQGNTIDFLLTSKRDRKAALRFFNKAISNSTEPEKINIDKSGSNTAGIERYNYDEGAYIEIRQCKYLNNIVEQDHRFIKKIVVPTLGFKSFRAASATIAGVELMHMIKKGQLIPKSAKYLTFAEQFYSLAM
jgi:putative transposase